MIYIADTLWQAERYNIRVLVPGFTTAVEAADFGAFVKSLALVKDQDYLVLIDGDDQRHEIRDDNVIVMHQRLETWSKLVVDDNDFDVVDINIQDFHQYPDLKSFGSLAYGVRDSDGNPVDVDAQRSWLFCFVFNHIFDKNKCN